MRAEKFDFRLLGFWLCAFLCVLPAIQPAISDAAKMKKPAAREQTAVSREPMSDLSGAPSDGPRARLEWAGSEANRLRAIIAKSPRDQSAGVLMAALAVVVATDLERALSAGDADSAVALRKLIERKLPDTRWRLGFIGRHGAGGGYFALGVMALHGILGERDREVACPLFSSAWDQGFLDSAYRLSDCVAEKDPARAEDLLRAAAESGHAMASEQLGRRCLEAKPQDLKCAFTRISAAAAAGRASAKSLLGWMYAQGAGVGADPQRALALYLEAANAGDLSAKNNLGELHETGRGVPVNPAKAVEYYGAAAEAGFAPAQFNLGRLYAAGTGVARDADKARTWLRSAMSAGIRPAQKILDWLDTQQAPGKP